MTTRFGLRALAICLIGAAVALAPQTASARGFHGGGFRGGWGGGFRGGWGGGFRGGWGGRGFYGGGYYPRYYGGFYPRYNRGFYPGLAVGLGLGYGLGYGYGGYGYAYPGYYGGYSYPVYYGGYSYPATYGNCVCANNGLNYGTVSVVSAPPAYVGTTVVSAPRVYVSSPSVPVSPPASVAAANIAASPSPSQSAKGAQFAFYLRNNPYRKQAIPNQSSNSGSLVAIKPNDLYRSASNTKTVDAPPAPGL